MGSFFNNVCLFSLLFLFFASRIHYKFTISKEKSSVSEGLRSGPEPSVTKVVI